MLSYLVHCCVSQACWMLAYAVPARTPALKLVTDEVVHPIRRHYTPSDRVQRNGSGAALPGLGLLDAGMCSVSEEARAQACYR